jgi:hypothetical protein
MSLRHPRGPGVAIIGKRHSGANERIVLDRDPLPYTYLILYGNVVPDRCSAFHKCVVTDVDIATNPRALHDVRKRPNARSATDLICFNERLWVNLHVLV